LFEVMRRRGALPLIVTLHGVVFDIFVSDPAAGAAARFCRSQNPLW
jgi:hypothetical protein